MTLQIRHRLRPGDLGRLTALQGEVYAAEYGYDMRFEAYVAETLGEFGCRVGTGTRDRLWLVEREDGELLGSIGIVERDAGQAQLRWFLLAAEARGRGLGHQLLDQALDFCRAQGFRGVYLWTVTGLPAAAHLYLQAGFRLTEQKPAEPLWGPTIAEQRYDLDLTR
jgi:GNAT superfamily N-acetyltransferase